jgi:gliding motility-associated lipoprotein GldH
MRLLLLSIPLLFLAACNNNVVYSEYKSIPEEEGWAVKNKLSFEAEIRDTTHRHDVYIIVRNADAYPYRNLFMFLETKYPDGNVKTDTIECILANEKGNWLGSGSGDLWDNSILFKKNTVFPRKGTYTFTFQQAMRFGDKAVIDPLPLILDVGITIEKSK